MLFDTHAHLSDARFDPDRPEVLARAHAAGITRLMEIGDSPLDWAKVLSLRSSPRPTGEVPSATAPEGGVGPQVFASLGFHPHYAQDFKETAVDALRREKDNFVALGEIGLDYVVSTAPKEVQIPVLRRMLALAVELGKPVVIHCRDAFADLFPLLEEVAPALSKGRQAPGVIHCFTGGTQEAEKAVALGFYLGVDGPVTYPKNEPLRQALKTAGLDRLVLETDSPYLPPKSSRGQRNEPAKIPEVAAKVAELFGVSAEEAARRTTENALRLFRLR